MNRLLHVYATFATGGPQTRFAAIANHFGRRWHHDIIAMDGNLACRERLDTGLSVGFPQVEIRKGDIPGNLRRIRGFLRAARPDLLVTNNWGSIEFAMAALGSGVRHVHAEDGFGPEERERQLPRRVLARRLVLRNRLVVVPSLVLRRITTEVWKLRHVRYIPNGIDLGRFVPGATGNAVPVVGTVAALRAEKNLARLLEAVAPLAARLLVVGDGPERAMLEARAAALGMAERVEFAGHQADPARFYARMDVFALSSDTEQMPMSVLEAMAAGLPVAATAVGDVAAMLAPENGAFIVPLGAAPLSGALAGLLGDAGLRARLGAANRAKAERDYADATMFARYAALFDGT
jgi:glycosyltransferase involved in cell wall biosynthesis